MLAFAMALVPAQTVTVLMAQQSRHAISFRDFLRCFLRSMGWAPPLQMVLQPGMSIFLRSESPMIKCSIMGACCEREGRLCRCRELEEGEKLGRRGVDESGGARESGDNC